MKKNDLFRQIAVNRLSSPEQLDSLLQVTSSRGWIALSGLGMLIATALVWSFAGRIPTKLVGQQCILVKNGGVNLLTTSAAGRLSDLAVEVGDRVTRGQIIGRLEQYDLPQKIKASEAHQRDMDAQYQHTLAVAAQSVSLNEATARQQGKFLGSRLAAAREKARLLKERIGTQGALYEQGLITRQTLIDSQLELAAVQLDADSVESQIRQLEVTRLDAKKQADHDVMQARNQLEEARRATALMAREAKSVTLIASPYTGRVLEMKATEGQLVERGTGLMSIESIGADMNEMEAYIYLPAADGKKVGRGMKVEVSPSTARREEYGYLPAFVASVADYPSTDQGLMRVFGNDKLVQQLSGTLAPIQILASLQPSPRNASRYEWSTRSGPPFQIQSGTSCSAMITLGEQRPVELVIPLFKKFFGLH